MAARSPVLALIIRTASTSSMSSAVTRFSKARRSAATCRLKGLPGPPWLPLVNLPSAARPAVPGRAAGSGARVIGGSLGKRERGVAETEVTEDMEVPFDQGGNWERTINRPPSTLAHPLGFCLTE